MSFDGLRIPIGRQLSGWVAAHKQTVVNADPQFDFIEVFTRSSKACGVYADSLRHYTLRWTRFTAGLTRFSHSPRLNTLNETHTLNLQPIGRVFARKMAFQTQELLHSCKGSYAR